MDLSAYIDFTVQLDYTQNKVVLTDTSTYPVGISVGIKGIFNVTHPDLITDDGNWNSPDTLGTRLTNPFVDLKELRRNSSNKPQCGSYTVTYTIDHASYTPTTLTKTFYLQYEPVTGEITENFDVFTPELSVSDNVVYTRSNFSTTSITRSWEAVVGTVDTVTGTAATLDLSIGGNYYDASYDISLDVVVNYQSTTYSYLSIKDSINTVLETQANTPPTTCELLSYLNVIKGRQDALDGYCQSWETSKTNFEYGMNLYMLILHNLLAGNHDSITTYVDEFLRLYYNAAPTYINTNTIIPAYTFCYPAGEVGIYSSVYSTVYA